MSISYTIEWLYKDLLVLNVRSNSEYRYSVVNGKVSYHSSFELRADWCRVTSPITGDIRLKLINVCMTKRYSTSRLRR